MPCESVQPTYLYNIICETVDSTGFIDDAFFYLGRSAGKEAGAVIGNS